MRIKNAISDLLKETNINFEKVKHSITSKANILESSLKTEFKLAKVTLRISQKYLDKSMGSFSSKTQNSEKEAPSFKIENESHHNAIDKSKDFSGKSEAQQTEASELNTSCNDELGSTQRTSVKQEQPKGA